MDYSQNAVALVNSSEGCVLHAYPDAGGWSIGWGTHADWVKEGMACTQIQADGWRNDKMKEIAGEISGMVKVPVNQNQFDALVDFCYNLGSAALAGSTLLKFLNSGATLDAAVELPKWCNDNHVMSHDLLMRRLRELRLFLTPA